MCFTTRTRLGSKEDAIIMYGYLTVFVSLCIVYCAFVSIHILTWWIYAHEPTELIRTQGPNHGNQVAVELQPFIHSNTQFRERRRGHSRSSNVHRQY